MNPHNPEETLFDVEKLSHVNFYYKDFSSAIHFFITGLGFKPSDIIDPESPHPLSTVLGNQPLCFLRLNNDHHSSALFPDVLRMRDKKKNLAIQQFSWEVSSYEQVKNGVDFLKKSGVEIDFIGRRMPGSNYNLYFWDPEGFRIEITWGMEQVGWSGFTKPLASWDELRMYDRLPDGPVLPDVVESRKKMIWSGEKSRHSLDGYDIEKWEDTGKRYNVAGVSLPRPFSLIRPAYLGLVVENLPRSVDFYTKILGLRLEGFMNAEGKIMQDLGENNRVALLSAAGDGHHLCLYPIGAKNELGFDSTGLVVHVAFEVETMEVKDSMAYFKETGIQVLTEGKVGPRGDQVVDTRDPEGRVVRLVCRKKAQGIPQTAIPIWKPADEG